MEGNWLLRAWHRLSTTGLLLGTLFFAASLTPSLLPRTFSTQGMLSGCSLTVGYGFGVFGGWLWTYMELLKPAGSVLRAIKLMLAAICMFVALAFLWQAAEWQNSI